MDTEADIVREIGLRIKFHFVSCCKHDHENTKHEKLLTKQIVSWSNIDYTTENYNSVLTNLKSSKYIPYSCIVIYINCMNCDCNPTLLDEVIGAMKKNIYLRYKSKLLLTTYYVKYLAESGSKIGYNLEKLDNTILFEYVLWDEPDLKSFDFIHKISTNPKTPIQDFLHNRNAESYYLGRLFHATTRDGLYFYNINPALAIICNNYYFSSPHTNREYSEYDVVKLMRELNAAGIPFILEQDCSREELLKILEYLKMENFNPVKSFFFFMMSHGDQNNIIYTKDGHLNIHDDIIQNILSNATLKDAKKLIVLNACRGSIHPYFGTDDDIDKVNEMPPTTVRNMDENTIVLYSVTELLISPRVPDFGSPFMQNFLKYFRNMIFLQDDLKNLHKKLEQNLKKLDYFYCVEKCSELVISDPHKSCKILQISRGSLEMLDLIERILNNFPTLKRRHYEGDKSDYNLKATFCICGSLIKTNLANTFLPYLPTLNDDKCFVDDERP